LGEVTKIFKRLLFGFLVSVAVGVIVTVVYPSIGRELAEYLRNSFGGHPRLRTFSLFLMIFLNNSKTATIAMLTGIIFGLGSWFIVLFNGFMVGAISTAVYETGRRSALQIVLLLIPHGVIEIPAILLSATAGVLLYKNVRRGRGKEGFKLSLKLLGISVVMLFIAALIESFVTPVIGKLAS